LERDIKEYKREYEEEWLLCYEMMKENKYEEYFPGCTDPEKETELKSIFLVSFINVITRCFGWGLPKTMVVPFADCINHHNVDSNYEMFSEIWHDNYKEEGPDAYYTMSKQEIDYSDFWIGSEREESYRALIKDAPVAK